MDLIHRCKIQDRQGSQICWRFFVGTPRLLKCITRLDRRLFCLLFPTEKVPLSLTRSRMMLSRINALLGVRLLPAALLMLAALVAVTGCGSSTPAAPSSTVKAEAASPAVASARVVSDATNVVAQFLDAIRRGGETSGANQLLTEQAQSVLQRLGRTVQPIGSPDAVFTVTRAESVPEAPGAALVHSTWTEPVGDGKTESYQVVWALEDETAGWRISGLAMDLEPGKEPMIVDFENAGQMASLLNSTDAPAAVEPSGRGTLSQVPPSPEAVQR